MQMRKICIKNVRGYYMRADKKPEKLDSSV